MKLPGNIKQGQVFTGYGKAFKMTEVKLKKGDHIESMGEIGVVNKVKGQVAYVKFGSNPKSFHPILVSTVKYKGKHKGKDLYTESINEAKAKKVTKNMWKKMSDDEKYDALLTVVKDPDDAEEYIESKWNNLPSGFERDMYTEAELPDEGFSDPDQMREAKFYVTYNKGRGQGKGILKSSGSNWKKPQVFKSYKDAEKYIGPKSSHGMTAYWVSDINMNRVNKYGEVEESVNEGQPMFQDTPNEFAYLDFKKWVYKNRKAVKNIILKSVGNGRDPGTDTFLALRQIWLAWANKSAKEYSRIPNKGPQGKDFGRALAIMMKKDNLIIKKSGNKLIDLNEAKLEEGKSFIGKLKEATSLWKHFDKLQNLRMDSMDLEDDMRSIAKDLSQTHKDMEQEAEPEGGKVADKYGKEIAKLEKEYKKKKAEFKKLMAKIDKLDRF